MGTVDGRGSLAQGAVVSGQAVVWGVSSVGAEG